MAREAGVDARTIDQDYQIYLTFYAPEKTIDVSSIVSPAMAEPPVGLTREHHVIALKADDPRAALSMFASKAADDISYTTEKARADLGELRKGTPIKAVEDIHWVNVPFDRNDIQLLRKIAGKLGMAEDVPLRDVTIESVRRFWSDYLAYSRKPEHIKTTE